MAESNNYTSKFKQVSKTHYLSFVQFILKLFSDIFEINTLNYFFLLITKD